jgi:hypothetical protein
LRLFFDSIGDRNAALPGVTFESDARTDTDQAKWFLRVFAGGNKLNAITISELYLSGYSGIELLSPGKEPLPTRNIIAAQEERVTIDLIQKRVSEHFNLREQDLKVRSNTRAIAFPRQVAMYIVKQLTTASLPEIWREAPHDGAALH